MDKQVAIVTNITKAKGRKSLYHFTRIRNLPTIAHLDALLSSYQIYPYAAGEQRIKPREVDYLGDLVTINAHLRIPEQMMDAECTLEQFRSYLDRHVFLWPTIKDCQKMLDTYTRREPNEAFAILEFDAYSLLSHHYSKVKLSKYDSGSSPRFPKHCTYKKSQKMFLPISEFGHAANPIYPSKASEIKEILVEDEVSAISHYLRSIYVGDSTFVPECWRGLVKDLREQK